MLVSRNGLYLSFVSCGLLAASLAISILLGMTGESLSPITRQGSQKLTLITDSIHNAVKYNTSPKTKQKAKKKVKQRTTAIWIGISILC